MQLYKSGLCGTRPLNTDFEALAVQNSLRLVLTMFLWSTGRPGRENKVSDTLQLHSLGEFPRPILGNLNILKSPCCNLIFELKLVVNVGCLVGGGGL